MKYSVGNIVNNNVVPVYGELTRFITMIILKCIEVSNHYAVLYRYESWTIKKAECQRIDAFKFWWWRRL